MSEKLFVQQDKLSKLNIMKKTEVSLKYPSGVICVFLFFSDNRTLPKSTRVCTVNMKLALLSMRTLNRGNRNNPARSLSHIISWLVFRLTVNTREQLQSADFTLRRLKYRQTHEFTELWV